MGTLAEVDEAVRTYRAAGNQKPVLLQCVSNYPLSDLSQLNLRVLETFARAFPVHIGLSDHTEGNTAAIAAVALGARVVEKHFVLDKKMLVPDNFFSADPAEMSSLVRAIRDTEVMLGDGHKEPARTEWSMRLDTRKSIIARRMLPAGHQISEDDIIIKRPGHGILPSMLAQVIGRRTCSVIEEDTPITWDLI